VSAGSGDGFVELPDGTRRWGLFGAAGLLLRYRPAEGDEVFFLARRSEKVFGGAGQWGLPGGARDAGESPLDAAVREFHEEIGRHPGDLVVLGEYIDEHHTWSYVTVVAHTDEWFDPPAEPGWETAETGWFTRDELDVLTRDPGLHPGLHAALPALLALAT
jgi:8-oxo-dGTP diphosphatase